MGKNLVCNLQYSSGTWLVTRIHCIVIEMCRYLHAQKIQKLKLSESNLCGIVKIVTEMF